MKRQVNIVKFLIKQKMMVKKVKQQIIDQANEEARAKIEQAQKEMKQKRNKLKQI